jgi:hypothetical protein
VTLAASDEAGRRGDAAAPGPGGWLGLAAAPTFAVMALLTSVRGEGADMMCSAVHGGPALGGPALGGMATMYLLMSAFHASPWLRLIARWRGAALTPRG